MAIYIQDNTYVIQVDIVKNGLIWYFDLTLAQEQEIQRRDPGLFKIINQGFADEQAAKTYLTRVIEIIGEISGKDLPLLEVED